MQFALLKVNAKSITILKFNNFKYLDKQSNLVIEFNKNIFGLSRKKNTDVCFMFRFIICLICENIKLQRSYSVFAGRMC